jgi:ERCC4-type nuclease
MDDLPLGDFAWAIEIKFRDMTKKMYMLDYIIERKTADDLASSIMDGRYQN